MGEAKRVAVIGLGSMGLGVARSLLRGGHTVWGVDIDAAREESFRGEGGAAGTLPDIARDLDAVVVVVVNAAQTEAVLFDDPGVVAMLREGAVVAGCATVAPEFARSMEARCADAGVLYVDAPISGGPKRAQSGELSIMAAARPDAMAAARPVFDAMSANVFHLGDAAGAGSAMKAVNQLLVGVHIAALAEAMTFGMTQGVTPERFMEVISVSAGNSWAIGDRGPHIVTGDYAPYSVVDIWPKDLGIVADIAREAKFSAPLVTTALQQFLAASGMGLGREDDAAVAKVYARNAGLTLPGED